MLTSSFVVTEPTSNQPRVALMDGRWLVPEIIDYCSDRDYDWIGLLPVDREIELDKFNLPRVNHPKFKRSCCLTTSEIVKSTFPAPYQAIKVCQKAYWSYTCSLQAVGFGKVRFAVYFDNPHKLGSFIALITNRLNWSTSRILKCWAQHYPISTLCTQRKILEIPKHKFLQTV